VARADRLYTSDRGTRVGGHTEHDVSRTTPRGAWRRPTSERASTWRERRSPNAIPVGSLLVANDDKVRQRSRNTTLTNDDITAHLELEPGRKGGSTTVDGPVCQVTIGLGRGSRQADTDLRT
jgi:hypothetical protein